MRLRYVTVNKFKRHSSKAWSEIKINVGRNYANYEKYCSQHYIFEIRNNLKICEQRI